MQDKRSSETQAIPLFSAGELALVVDRNGKQYLVRLREGGEFHFHQGLVLHDDVIGKEQGACLATSKGNLVWAYQPRMYDYLMEMPRNSAIIYPKDIAFLLMWGDVFPGARVFEAGVGSGALAIALLRAIGAQGSLVTYESRADMIQAATRNAHGFLGETPNWTIRQRDVFEGIDDGPFDRVMLDLPDPGRVAPHAAAVLVPGGIVCSYVPNVTQVEATVEAYRSGGLFVEIETYETLYRPWQFRGRSARPAHYMVAHTGFLTIARRGRDRPAEP
jgi:tRNA (adenine57-N1/adenine58-N1)-methyltransferase